MILSRALLARQLAETWRNLLRRARPASPAGMPDFLSLDGQPETRRLIRQVYQVFLGMMKTRGRPRQRGQTPAEYQRDVQAIAPAAHDAPGVVTDAYQQARYAAQEPSSATAATASRAWGEIEKSLKPKEAE